MKNILLLICILSISISSNAQTIESRLQSAIDSIYNAHPASIGIMVHVEAPDMKVSWSGASGYSNKDNKTPIQADQPALIASSIKTIVSATILKLVEKGALTLDTPINQLLSKKTIKRFQKDGYDFSKIKVKHLLSHTSGIEDYANQEYIDFQKEHPTYRWTRKKQLKRTVKVGNPLGHLGQQFSYADANYLLLTEIMEQLTGKPFYESMRSLLQYDKIGMQNTWFPTLEDKPAGTKTLVHQYWGAYNWDAYDLDVSWDLYGGGGIACPTKDLVQFIYHFFNGDIVQDEAISKSIFTYIPTKETEEHPYYLGLGKDHYHGMDAFGHGGFWGTVMMYFPDINTAISVYILDRDQKNLRRDVLDATSLIILNNKNK